MDSKKNLYFIRNTPKIVLPRISGFFFWIFFVLAIPLTAQSQHSVAREWNEALLTSIRNDFARPPVHARNLFHTAVAMYDAWAAYDEVAETYLLGKSVGGYEGCSFAGVSAPDGDIPAARHEAISYAAYRLLKHRFLNSPGAAESFAVYDSLMNTFGYDTTFVSVDYESGSPAALGNYIAQCLIDFGFQDRSNEADDYENQYYQPVNPPMIPAEPGNPLFPNPNRWQPLTLEVFIDQGGNIIPGATIPFQSPEWGLVTPFALTDQDLQIFKRGVLEFWVYLDPGPPPFIDPANGGDGTDEYRWNFSLVSAWGAHLDPTDGILWDISPASIGNLSGLPETAEEYHAFYDLIDGGDGSPGHTVNPKTGLPYEPQVVPRGDYARVLAEFWADGPDSETPPGHWFTILNYVNDHPLFEKRLHGEGPIVDNLEWDVKAYFTLGGAMHDAAVAAWGIKGWYDYVRPISAIRYMAELGQSSDPSLDNYSPAGLPLIPGLFEVVEQGDPLAGRNREHVGKIKLYTWRGHDYVNNPETDVAGVGWILAENWWPYQRPTFVTPPFAGYVSGHSTFSRAAAEVLTLLTGDPFFPGGMGEFVAKKNEFLVFEEGPSVDVHLQWATYRDASDQTSLSRIWGGIHPPADDIPGRKVGITVGTNAYHYATTFFGAPVTDTETPPAAPLAARAFPNPIARGSTLTLALDQGDPAATLQLFNLQGQLLQNLPATLSGENQYQLNTAAIPAGAYLLRITGKGWTRAVMVTVVE